MWRHLVITANKITHNCQRSTEQVNCDREAHQTITNERRSGHVLADTPTLFVSSTQFKQLIIFIRE